MVLFIWNFAPVVDVAGSTSVDGTAARLEATRAALDILDIIQFFDHDRSSSISQLISSKLRDLHKLIKYFNETTTSVFNKLLSAGAFPIIFSYFQKVYFLLSRCYLSYNYQNYFISVIIHFISIIISKTSWCHRIMVNILHWHDNIRIFCIVYRCVINFWYARSKWSIILKG